MEMDRNVINLLYIVAFMALLIAWGIWNDRRTKAKAAERAAAAARRAAMAQKWGEERADRIVNNSGLETGDPAELILDMLGPPANKTVNQLKTKRKEIWYYFPGGQGHDLRLDLEGLDPASLALTGWQVREGEVIKGAK